MDSINDDTFRPTDKASIALLRRLRDGGADDVHYVHRVDVCDAPPEVLVADLEPVPGTGLHDGGYSSVWYCYHAKKFTNKQGKLSGHRQRKVTGGGGAGWHSEISPKGVQGSGGGTSCTLSYGRKTHPSARSIDRMGWCMVEYDLGAAADNLQDEAAAAAASNYVLCKVYRSPRAKGKPASTSSSSKNASSKQTAKKRKARGGDHPEAPPAKLIQQQKETACYQPQGVEEWEHGGDFNFNIEDLNFYVDESMLRAEQVPEPEPGLQQPIAALEHDGRFIQELPCGPVLAAEACTVGDMHMLGPETVAQPGTESEAEHGDKDLNMEEFTVEWLLRGEPQLPIVETPLGHGAGEFIQMPFGPMVPVVAETTFEDMLGLGAETVYGQWSGGMTTASIPPWSSYSSYAGCSSLLQGPDPLHLPYLTC